MTTEFTNSLRPPLSLRRLVSCVRALGWRLGWRYWRIQNRVLRNPEAAKEWAARCRREAVASPKELAGCLLDWAVKLEESMEQYAQRQEAANS